MQITIDDQVFAYQQRGGISRYFVELLAMFQSDHHLGIEVQMPFRYVMSDYLIGVDPGRFRRAALPKFAQRGRVIRSLNRVRFHRSRDPQQIVHHTYYLPDALQVPACARLCTIYDMIPELFPDVFGGTNPHVAKAQYVEQCDAIVCISHTTKRDLLKIYGNVDKPVVVTPLGVSDRFFKRSTSSEGPSNYVLYVGIRGFYKNFEVLLKAFTKLADSRPTLQLLCVGPPFEAEEHARLEELGVADRVLCRSVGDEDLPALFSGAVCLVYPSLYEGFGLPIIEAFAADCPVIIADTPTSLEVAGDAAQVFSPDDDDALAAMIDQMVGDPAARRRWIEEGQQRVKEFTWHRTAELTADLYRQVAGSARP